MISQELRIVALALAVSLASLGCQPTAQLSAQNQVDPSPPQEKASSKVVRSKLDDDSIRARLLVVETVQADLGLTSDQVEKIRDSVKTAREINRDFAAKAREILPPSGSFSPEEAEVRQKEFRALSEDFKSKRKEFEAKMLAMLTPSQDERLKQIQLQAAIPAALARPEIIKALDISEEQCGKIRALSDKMEKGLRIEWQDLRNLGPKERRQTVIAFMKESDEVHAKATKLILDILTPEQRAKFDTLQGKKIDVKQNYDASIPEDAEF